MIYEEEENTFYEQGKQEIRKIHNRIDAYLQAYNDLPKLKAKLNNAIISGFSSPIEQQAETISQEFVRGLAGLNLPDRIQRIIKLKNELTKIEDQLNSKESLELKDIMPIGAIEEKVRRLEESTEEACSP